jgi:hypothetical protein
MPDDTTTDDGLRWHGDALDQALEVANSTLP